MHLSDVNFLAVGLATVLTFGLGAFWYSPLLFAKSWMAGHGYTQADVEAMQASMGTSYAISFVCWFVMATMLAMIAPHFGDSPGTIFGVGLHMWLGFSATVGLTSNRFSNKPVSVWLIDAGYQLASIAIMSVVLGLWS